MVFSNYAGQANDSDQYFGWIFLYLFKLSKAPLFNAQNICYFCPEKFEKSVLILHITHLFSFFIGYTL